MRRIQDAAYVQDRYSEIETYRRRQRSPQAGAMDVKDEDGDALARVQVLNEAWPASSTEKEVAVVGEILHELAQQMREKLEDVEDRPDMDQEAGAAAREPLVSAVAHDSKEPPRLGGLPEPAQFGLKVFFRVCASLRNTLTGGSATSARMLSLVAAKIPTMLEKLPPMALSPGVTMEAEASAGNPTQTTRSVFEELLSIFGSILDADQVSNGCEEAKRVPLNEGDRASILMAYVALSLKWGRLRYLLHTELLLMKYPHALASIHIHQLSRFIDELAQAKPEVPVRQILHEETAATGFLVSFGKGDHGKLGHGQCTHATCSDGNCTENKNVPTVISSIKDVRFVKIDSLSTHSIAITAKGEVLAWGNGDKYRLGHGTTAKEYAPRIIDSLSLKGKVLDVACGLGHTIALLHNGEIFAWGNGSNGRLGLGDTNDRANPTKIPVSEDGKNLPVGGTSSVTFRSVVCGASHSLALTIDGRIFTWGKNNQGQCGHGHTNDQLRAAEVRSFRDDLGERITQAAGGWEHTLFCSTSGRVYSCGCGYKDSRRTGIPPVLGHGDCEKRLRPTALQTFVDASEEIVRVSCGWDHSLAVSSQGSLYTWGSGTNGKLGHGDEENCEVPTLVRALAGKVVKDAKAGCEHTVALTDEHELWTFGQGDSGRLGLGDTLTRKVPTLVDFFSHSGLRPVAVAVGDKYNLVLAEEATALSLSSSQDSPAKRGLTGIDKLLSSRARRPKHSANAATEVVTARDLSHWLLGHDALDCESELQQKEVGSPTQMTLLDTIVGHVARLATGYLSTALRGDQLQSSHLVMIGGSLPYGVDSSPTTLTKIVELIRLSQDKAAKSLHQLSVERYLRIILASLRLAVVTIRIWSGQARSIISSLEHMAEGNPVHQLHEIVNGLHPLGAQKDEAVIRNGALAQLADAIEDEVALVLKIGFSLFYPSATHRLQLLWELGIPNENAKTPVSPRTNVLAASLCQVTTMGGVVSNFFKQSRKHVCISGFRGENSGALVATKSIQPNDARSLLQYALRLMRSCSSKANKRLDEPAETPDPRAPIEQQLLGAIQEQWFALSAIQSSPEGQDDSMHFGACNCSTEGLLTFLEALLDEALGVLKKLHKLTCQSDEVTSNRLHGSFVDAELVQAIQATHAIVWSSNITTVRRNNAFSERLLPQVELMLTVVDEIAWKTQASYPKDSCDSNEPSEAGGKWLVKLGGACGLLFGQLAGCRVAPSCSRIGPGSEMRDLVLELLGGDAVLSTDQSARSPPVAYDSPDNQHGGEEPAEDSLTMRQNHRDFLCRCLKRDDQSLEILYQLDTDLASAHPIIDPVALDVLRAGLVAIAWLADVTQDLKESAGEQVSRDAKSAQWNFAVEAYTHFRTHLQANSDAALRGLFAADRVKLLLRLHHPTTGINITHTPFHEWTSKLFAFLVDTQVNLREVETALELQSDPSHRIQDGLTALSDMLRQLNSPALKCIILTKLSQVTSMLSRQATPSQRSAFSADVKIQQAIASMCEQITEAAGSSHSSIQAKAYALGAWMWVLRSGFVPEASLPRLVGDCGLILCVGEVLMREPASPEASTRFTCPPSSTVAQEDSNRLRPHQASVRLRPVEALLAFGHADNTLRTVAYEVWSAAAILLCSNFLADAQGDKDHPLLRASRREASPLPTKETPTRPTSSSPRRRQTLPKRVLAAISVPDSTSLAFEYLLALLRKTSTTLKHIDELISPFISSRTNSAGSLNHPPCAAFLLASPIAVSSTRGHITKTLRLPHQSTTIPLAKPLLIAAVSFWLYISETSGHRESPSGPTALIAIGETSDRLQETSTAANGSQSLELQIDDDIRLMALMVESNRRRWLVVATSHHPRAEAFGDDARPSPVWKSFVCETSIEPGCWTNVVISASSALNPLVYVNGKLQQFSRVFDTTFTRTGMSTESFAPLTSRLQLVAGGTIADTLVQQLGLISLLPPRGEHDSEPTPSPSQDSKEIVIDDIWVFDHTLDTPTVQAIFSQGPTVLQLKEEALAKRQCIDLLGLLRRLLQISPMPASVPPNNYEPNSPFGMISTTDVIIHVLDHFFRRNACHAALLAVEVLKQVLPGSDFAEPSRGVLAQLTGYLLPPLSVSVELRREIPKLYASGARVGVQSAVVTTSQAATAALLRQQGFLDVAKMAGSDIAKAAPGHDSVSLGHSVFCASIVQLLQTLRCSPAWSSVCLEFVNKATTVALAVGQMSTVAEGELLAATSAITIVAGYSEIFINEQALAFSTCKHSRYQASSSLSLQRPWASCGSHQDFVRDDEVWSSCCTTFDADLLNAAFVLGPQRGATDDSVNISRDEDVRILRQIRVQSLLARSVASQFVCAHSSTRDRDSWKRRILLNATAVDALLAASVVRLKKMVYSRLGSSRTKACRLSSVRLLLDYVSRPKSVGCGLFVEDELEALTWELWTRFETQRQAWSQHNGTNRDWRSPAPKPSPLESLGGDVEIHGLDVRAIQHFPTVRLGRCTITANSGLWYYEAQVLTGGLMQIGYVDDEFVPDTVHGQGVGDHTNSWAFDGFRRKKWNFHSSEYGEAWQAGDTVGVLLDTDRMELSYFLNGRFLGAAFSNMPLTASTMLHPAVSLNGDQQVRLKLGGRSEAVLSSLQMPVLESPLDQQRLKPVADAIDEQTFGLATEEHDVDDDQLSAVSLADEDDGSEQGGYEYGEESHDEATVFTPVTPPRAGLSVYHPLRLSDDSVHSPANLPGTSHDSDSELVFSSASVGLSVARRELDREGDLDADREDPDSVHFETSQKTELVQSLLALGFPSNWATRCAQETSFTANDAGAVTWILEQMESEAVSSVAASLARHHDSEDELPGDSNEPHPTIPRRALDDLSLMSLTSESIGLAGRRAWQLSLSPLRDGRPHTEQHVRSRTFDFTSEKPSLRQASPHRESSTSTNPFLVAELEAEDDDELEDTVGPDRPIASQGCVGVYATGTTLRDQFYTSEGKAYQHEDETRKDKENGSPPVEQIHSTDQDWLPACVVSHSILTLAYVRLATQSLLFDPSSDTSLVYPVVVRWASQSHGGLFDFLRVQLNVNGNELPTIASRVGSVAREKNLWDSMVRHLRLEIATVATQHPAEMPLLVAVANKIRSRISKGVRECARVKAEFASHGTMSSTTLVVAAMHARWTGWLFGVSYEALRSQESNPQLQSAIASLLGASVASDLIKLAAMGPGVCLPWRNAALSMVKLGLRLQVPSLSSVVSIRDLFDLLACELRKESPQCISFSQAAHTLWEIALLHVPRPPHQSPRVRPAESNSLLRVDQIATTHATIAWDVPQEKLNPHADAEADPGCASDPVLLANCVLSLDVIEMPDRFAAADVKSSPVMTLGGRLPHSLPRKGTFVLRHLAADTDYIVRLMKSTTTVVVQAGDGDDTPRDLTESVIVREISMQTPPEPIFELDSEAMGSNLVLSNRSRSVKNLVNKKWHTVRASVGFEDGLHHWHVRIDTCVSKNIFIGVCTADASLENYVGSDAFGYGFLANKAVWHNKSKLHTYGEIFKQGDLLQVTLDCNARTLSYSRNGEFLGVAATNLHVSNNGISDTSGGSSGSAYKWFPAFSLYNKDDQLTLIVPSQALSTLASSISAVSQHASVLQLVDSTRFVVDYFAYLHSDTSITTMPTALQGDVYDTCVKWKRGEISWRELVLCDVVEIDSSRAVALSAFGLASGDSVFTSRGHCIVLGVYNHELWFEVSDTSELPSSRKAANLGSWSTATCRAMLASPDEYPIHRKRHHCEDDLVTVGASAPDASTDGDFETPTFQLSPVTLQHFMDGHQQLARASGLDSDLMRLVDALVSHRGLRSPYQLTHADLSSAFVLHDAVETLHTKFSNEPLIAPDALLMRMAFLFVLNRHVYRAIRFFLVSEATHHWELALHYAHEGCANSEQPKPRQGRTKLLAMAARLAAHVAIPTDLAVLDESSRVTSFRQQELLFFLREHLFEAQRDRLIKEALRRTATPTTSPSTSDAKATDLGTADDAASHEPKNMACVKVLRHPAGPAIPFWQYRLESETPAGPWLVPSPGDARNQTLFAQMSTFLASVDPRDCQREFLSPTDTLEVFRTFHVEYTHTNDVSPIDPHCHEDPEPLHIDFTTQYLRLWESIFTEIQSPRFPLLVPDESRSAASTLVLDVNAQLLLPEVGGLCGIRGDQARQWFFHLGQLLGIVWRARILVPLEFVSSKFWEDLHEEDVAACSSTDRAVSARAATIRAVRDGLCAVVPWECVVLSSPQSLRSLLSDADVFFIDTLCERAVFDRLLPSHRSFWAVVRGFTSLERRLLLQFLTGKSSSAVIPFTSFRDPIEQWRQLILPTAHASTSSLMLEIVGPLADAQDHPDACFPVVLLVGASTSRLHLPEYSSASVLREKLVLAMSTPAPL